MIEKFSGEKNKSFTVNASLRKEFLHRQEPMNDLENLGSSLEFVSKLNIPLLLSITSHQQPFLLARKKVKTVNSFNSHFIQYVLFDSTRHVVEIDQD